MEVLTEVKPVYSYFDIKAREWSDPQVHESYEALCQFLSVIINAHGSGAPHTNPEDFVCYEIGTFNPENGVISVHEEKEMVVVFSGLKNPCPICEREMEKQMEMVKDE